MRSAQASPRSDTDESKHRVLVVDDHPIVRQGLTMLINREPDLMVCGEAEEMHSATQAIESLRPDIVLLDISLGGPDGLELLKQLRARDDELPVLILSMHEESIYAERVLRAGANGYIMKQEATELVLTALRRILAGQVYVGDRVAARMLGQYVRGAVAKRPPLASLSDRELEVFRMIGDGSSTREIAEALHLSIKTVESYQAHIKEKLALRTGRELQHYAIEWRVGEKDLDR
ncbi:MAG TPA: response regulator transcription factor [Propionibacteriaceae bacterium]|nr:response regulator transcription factor [Propionibacteriaceae bacterium]